MNELTGTIPRDVRLTGYGIAIAAVASALAIGALVSAIVMSVVIARSADRGARVRVDADVLDVSTIRGEHPRRAITYRFEARDRAFQGRSTVKESEHRDVVAGAQIPVEYVGSDPASNWIAGHEPGGIPRLLVPIVSGVLIVIASILAQQLRRQWVLLSEGRGALARVAGSRKVHRDKHTAYEVSCTFQDLSGATHTMRYDVSKAPPPAGTTVAIVYHRDNPRWHAVYPLRFVRPLRAPAPDSRRKRNRARSFLEGSAQR
jgi:hypothetical protein